MRNLRSIIRKIDYAQDELTLEQNINRATMDIDKGNFDFTKHKKDIFTRNGKKRQIYSFEPLSTENILCHYLKREIDKAFHVRYKYFARTDYKACFDSVYTHTYTWIIGKNVTDTKKFKNVNLYATIDRVLMNINSRSSNGIVVGPEFSRMIAELLLQRIDITVYNQLLNDGLVNGMDYNIFRYVDDIFIFAKSEELIDKILTCYSEAARKYLLSLNERKLTKNKVPFILEQWLKETNLYTNRASTLMFKSKAELREEKQKIKSSEGGKTENACLFKAYVFITVKSTLMNHFNNLMCTYSDKCRTIVAYVLGMMLNKVSRNKDQVRIFRKNVSPITVFSLIDFVLYIYSFFPDFTIHKNFLGFLAIFETNLISQKKIRRRWSLINMRLSLIKLT